MSDAFAEYLRECKRQYDEVCNQIDNGDVPADHAVTVSIRFEPKALDMIRFDRLAASVEAN